MISVAILAPGLVLGAIAWGVVGVLRNRGREEFTLATAVAFYARVLTLAGVLAVLAGLAVLVKLGISQIDPAYSYFVPANEPFYGGPSIATQQSQDLILASMLVGIGLIVTAAHALLARFVNGLKGGSIDWIRTGAVLALTVLTGLAGFISAIVGGYSALSYFITSSAQTGMTFGDPVGGAIVFLPAWGVTMFMLLRTLRARTAPPVTGRMVPAT